MKIKEDRFMRKRIRKKHFSNSSLVDLSHLNFKSNAQTYTHTHTQINHLHRFRILKKEIISFDGIGIHGAEVTNSQLNKSNKFSQTETTTDFINMPHINIGKHHLRIGAFVRK